MKFPPQHKIAQCITLLMICIIAGCNSTLVHAQGNLVLINFENDRDECRIALSPARTIAKNKYHDNIPGCNFKYFRVMYLEDAPSAVELDFRTFWFSINGPFNACYSPDPFYSYRAEIKTIGRVPLSEQFDIVDILQTDVSDPVIKPGVRLLSKSFGTNPQGSPIERQFACVHITHSP